MLEKCKKTNISRYYDQDGRAVIDMSVEDDSEFLCVYSRSNTPVISTEVAEFIEDSAATVSPKEKLTLKIYSSCIDENEQRIYKDAIKSYYAEKSIANDRELKKNNIIAIALLVFGIAVLALSLLMSYVFSAEIGAEVIDIVAWVLIWEATDISIFKNSELRVKKKRYQAYTEMKIIFTEKSEEI